MEIKGEIVKDNRILCDYCTTAQDALTNTIVKAFPRRLVVQLMIFGESTKLFYGVKVTEAVILGKVLYELYAIVIHDGSSNNSGHYYTIALDDKDTVWVFNDEKVSRASNRWIPAFGEPYLLFYRDVGAADIHLRTDKDDLGGGDPNFSAERSHPEEDSDLILLEEQEQPDNDRIMMNSEYFSKIRKLLKTDENSFAILKEIVTNGRNM